MVGGAAETLADAGTDPLQDLHAVPDDHGADSGAEDDPHLGRCSLDDRTHRTVVQDVEPEDTAEQHDETDYDEHL